MPKIRLFTLTFGILPTLLGTVVLVGWYTHNTLLIQVSPAFVPMQYNTALGFLLSGAGLLFAIFHYLRPAQLCGTLVALIGLLTLAEYGFRIDLGIDQLLMEHYVTTATSNPGRMAPNTALSFAITGIALLIVVKSDTRKVMFAIVGVLGALTFGLGSIAAAGYATNLETAYGWGNLTRMAIHTSVGFLFLGIGLISYAWSKDLHQEAMLPLWFSYVIAIGTLTITVSLWQALNAVQAVGISQYFVLVFGLVTALALGALVHLVSNLKRIADERAEHLSSEISERSKAERQIHESETQLRELMNSSSAGVGVNIGGVPVYANAKLIEMMGFGSEEEFIHTLPEKFYANPSDREKLLKQFEKDKRVSDAEIQINRRDGTVFWALLSLDPVHFEGQNAVVFWITDITQIKNAENRLRAIFETSPAGVGISVNGKAIYGNAKIVEMRGYGNLEEYYAAPTIDAYADPKDQERLLARLDQDKFISDEEILVKRKDGSTFWSLFSLYPIEFEGQKGLINWIFDITEIKDSESQMREILQSSSVGVGISVKGKPVFANDRFIELLGYKERDKFMSLNTADFYADGDERTKLMERLNNEGSITDAEVRLVRENGEEFWTLLSVYPFIFKGQKATLAWLYDISERLEQEKALEEANEASAEKEIVLRDAIESISEGFVIYYADDRLVICNEQYRSLFPTITDIILPGITFEELIDTGLAREQYGGVTAERDKEEIKKERMDHHRNPSGIGVHQQMADGRWMLVRERRTGSGGIAGIRADITELKEAEAVQQRQKEIIEATLENVGQGVIMVDEDGTILAFNNFFEDQIGFAIGDFTNFEEWTREYLNSIGADDESIEASLRTIKDNKAGSWEREIPDGRVYFITHIPLDSGGYVRTYNDITIRKKAEDELRLKMKEAESFNKVAVGRELKMIELKKEINLLREETGDPDRYQVF